RGAAEVAVQTIDADRTLVDVVVTRLADRPCGAAVDGLREVRVPHVVDIVLRVWLRACPAMRAVEDDVDDARRACLHPPHHRRVDTCRIRDRKWRRCGSPAG